MTENYIFERLSEVFPQLSHNQLRFVTAMLECPTKKDAAEAIGLQPQTIYRWPDVVDEAVELAREHMVESAVQVLERSTLKAAMVKITGLDSDDERIRQDSAGEILDRMMGKPTQRSEVTGKDGGDMTIRVVYTDGTDG